MWSSETGDDLAASEETTVALDGLSSSLDLLKNP